MTPEQYIKKAIVRYGRKQEELSKIQLNTPEEVEAAYQKDVDDNVHWDAEADIRSGEIETPEIECDWSRHYESKAVAAKIDDVWVGWTYWYGGGKHGQPESIDWMEDAYFLECKEEEKLIVVREFKKI